LPSDQTFAGNLVCSANGSSITTSCTESGGTITWTGTVFPGNSNTIIIAFDVQVAGEGTYNNTATLNDGTTSVDASASVSIGGDGNDDDDDDDGDALVCCPTATPTPGPTPTLIPGDVQFGDITELPATGQMPWWNLPLLISLTLLVVSATVGGVVVGLRRLRQQKDQ
jgi:hypothetical protein